MIANPIPKKVGLGRGSFVASLKYIRGGSGERVVVELTRGIYRPDLAAIEMDAVAATSSRCKDPVTHWIVSWASGEVPTHEEVRTICETLLADLGLAEAQYVVVVHGDTDNMHAHIVANRVVGGRAAQMTKSVIVATKSMARQGLLRGYDIVKSPHVKSEASEQAARRGLTMEQFEAYWASPSTTLRDWVANIPGEPHLTAREQAQVERGVVPFAVEFRDELTAAFTSSATWETFEAVCAERGLCLLVEAKKGQAKVFPGVRFRTVDLSRGESGSKLGLPYRILRDKYGAHATEKAALETLRSPAPEADMGPKIRLTPAEGRLLAAHRDKQILDGTSRPLQASGQADLGLRRPEPSVSVGSSGAPSNIPDGEQGTRQSDRPLTVAWRAAKDAHYAEQKAKNGRLFARLKEADWAERQAERAHIYKNKTLVETGIGLFFPRTIRNATRRAYRAALRRKAEELSRDQKARWTRRVEEFRAANGIRKPPTFPEFLGRRLLEHDQDAAALLRKIDPRRAAFLQRKVDLRATDKFRSRAKRISGSIATRLDAAYGERTDHRLNIFPPEDAAGMLTRDPDYDSKLNIRWLTAWAQDRLLRKQEREAEERRARDEAAEKLRKEASELLERVRERLFRLRGDRARGETATAAPQQVLDRLKRITAALTTRFRNVYWDRLVRIAQKFPREPDIVLLKWIETFPRDSVGRRREWLDRWIADQADRIRREANIRQVEDDRRALEETRRRYGVRDQASATSPPLTEGATRAQPVSSTQASSTITAPIAARLAAEAASAEPSKSRLRADVSPPNRGGPNWSSAHEVDASSPDTTTQRIPASTRPARYEEESRPELRPSVPIPADPPSRDADPERAPRNPASPARPNERVAAFPPVFDEDARFVLAIPAKHLPDCKRILAVAEGNHPAEADLLAARYMLERDFDMPRLLAWRRRCLSGEDGSSQLCIEAREAMKKAPVATLSAAFVQFAARARARATMTAWDAQLLRLGRGGRGGRG